MKDKLRPYLSESDKTNLKEIEDYLNILVDALGDRLLLMNGQISEKAFSLDDIFAHFFEDFSLTSNNGSLKKYFELRLPKASIWLRGNRISIMSLLCNLANNGFKFAKEFRDDGAKVVIEASVENKTWAVIKVSDNGPGISAEDLKNIWKPFHTTGGTGIGLTESRLIVKDHGGTIDVQSEPGKGTTFTVRLPIAPPAAQSPAPSPASPAAQIDGGQPGNNPGVRMTDAAPPVAQPPSPPDAPISDFQKDVGEILPYKHYSLAGGATLLTRLDDLGDESFREQYEVRDGENGSVFLRNRVGEYRYQDTPLDKVEKNLSISILERIRKLDEARKTSQQPNGPITILDWGCGDGTALIELSGRLKKEGISNIRLVGFSDRAYRKWNNAPNDIIFIWDTVIGFPLYFGEREVDFIYSHYGLSRIVWMHLEHLNQLRSILRHRGEIVSNFSNNAVKMFEWRLEDVGLNFEVLNANLYYPACRLFVDENMYIPIKKGDPGSFMRDRPRRISLSLTPIPSPGGINFTVLSAARQAISNLGLGDVPLAQLNRINLDEEQQEVGRLLGAGIMPSAERVKEYAQASLSQGGKDAHKVASCVMDILRMQEERCCQTEPVLKDILIVLEADRDIF